MNWRVTRLGWLIAAVVLAVVFACGMLFVSDANSCGGLDSGPNPGAEEKFCGFGSNEPADYSGLFVFVNLIPAFSVGLGGLLASLGLSRLFFLVGLFGSLLSGVLILKLEP